MRAMNLKIQSPSLKSPRVLTWRYFLCIHKKSAELRRHMDGLHREVKGEERAIYGQMINCFLQLFKVAMHK